MLSGSRSHQHHSPVSPGALILPIVESDFHKFLTKHFCIFRFLELGKGCDDFIAAHGSDEWENTMRDEHSIRFSVQ
jgi:hypothetical protein